MRLNNVAFYDVISSSDYRANIFYLLENRPINIIHFVAMTVTGKTLNTTLNSEYAKNNRNNFKILPVPFRIDTTSIWMSRQIYSHTEYKVHINYHQISIILIKNYSTIVR